MSYLPPPSGGGFLFSRTDSPVPPDYRFAFAMESVAAGFAVHEDQLVGFLVAPENVVKHQVFRLVEVLVLLVSVLALVTTSPWPSSTRQRFSSARHSGLHKAAQPPS